MNEMPLDLNLAKQKHYDIPSYILIVNRDIDPTENKSVINIIYLVLPIPQI